MSDLISRSDLVNLFEDMIFNDKLMNPVITMMKVVDIINEQPAVVEEKMKKQNTSQKSVGEKKMSHLQSLKMVMKRQKKILRK